MFIKNFLLSVISYLKAIRFLPYLWKYIFLFILLLLLFGLPIYLIDNFLQWLLSFFSFSSSIQYERWFISFLANLSGFFLLLVLSPVFSIISEEVFHKITGTTYNFSLAQLIKDVIRGLRITLRNFIYEYAFIISLYVLIFLFPKNHLFIIIFWGLNILVTSYFYGFTLLDYAMENQRMGYRDSVKFSRSHPGLVIGLGLVYYSVIQLNNLESFRALLGKNEFYWTAFGEALVAFIGVVAGTLALNQVLNKKRKT